MGDGSFVSLVGPSGSGKSSLLRAVIGLQQPLSGTVETELARSQVGILFQDDALLPWKTARDNVALGLTFNGMGREKALAEADAWLERLDLAGFGDRFPRRLSGGQRKRVALAQVLAMKPRLILMDEPFASLDAIVRARIVKDVVALVEREKISVLLVTHDLEEAISLSAVDGPLPRGGSSGGGSVMRLDPRYTWVRQLAAFAALLAVWEAAGRVNMLNPMYAPSPSRVAAALIDLFSDGRIWPHLEATFSAALGGLALGIAVGIVLGVVAALVPFIAELLEPVMTVLNAIPRVILAPLFVIWLGIGLASKIALSFILVAVLIFFTVFTGIRQVDRRLVERVITLGGDRWSLVRHVYLPSVASWVLGNLKIAVGFAFTGACVGEFVAATQGLGYLLSFAQSTYNAALMFALILLILVVVLIIFGIAGRLEKHLLRWN